jgi:hypothetical protein
MRAFGITWHLSFVVCHLLTFDILIFSSETHQPNELKLSRTPTKFRLIWPSGFRGGNFSKLANQKQELLVVAMFVNGLGQN